MIAVSIVMPTYNRRDTIVRAIESVRGQAFADWELVIVDDGSTDGTGDVVQGLDPRIRYLRQDNQGVAGARNAGLRAARGRLVAFLDSDDAWTPHHLALATAFFRAFPDQHVFTSEFWEDFGDQQYVRHYRPEIGEWYPATARSIGSTAFSEPPDFGDPYLWIYETRNPIGPWARPALVEAEAQRAYHYRGHIFRHWRWGWLMALQPTVITRHAMETVGPNDASYRVASDFGYLASLCGHFPVNFFSLPGAIKFELGDGKRKPSEGHLATGPTTLRFHEDVLRFHEELFWKHHPADPELSGLRGFRHGRAARAALALGRRDEARRHLEAEARSYASPEVLSTLLERRGSGRTLARLLLHGAVARAEAVGARVFERVVPSAEVASRLASGALEGARVAGRVRDSLRRTGEPRPRAASPRADAKAL